MTNGIYKTPAEFDHSLRGDASARKAHSRKQAGRAGARRSGLSRLFGRGPARRQAMRNHGNPSRRMGVVQDERPHRRRRVRAYPVTIVRRIKRGNRKRVRPPLDGNTTKIQSP